MTKKEIEKLAKELYDEVLAAYLKNPELSFNDILNKYLAEFNEEVQAGVLSTISEYTQSAIAMGASSMALQPLANLHLSPRLYNNAGKTAKAAKKVLDQHLATKSAIDEIREALYDGYGYGEVIDVKPKLPKYLQGMLTEEKLAKLKTKPLKAAYLNIMDAKNDKQMAKALKVALEEKARYYALRVAMTEEMKAYNIANAAKLKAEGVEYVKWTLSGSHRQNCVCDLYATMNVGFGFGIFPLNEAPMPVASTHPFCRCVLVSAKPERMRYSKDPIQSALDKFPVDDRVPIERGYRNGWGYQPVSDFI